jgi:hypothetical protein
MLLKTILCSVLLGLSGLAMADWAAVGPGGFVVAHTAACPSNIASLVPEEYSPSLRAMTGQIDGVEYKGCWLEHEGMVFIIWEDGSLGTVPVSSFKELKEA